MKVWLHEINKPDGTSEVIRGWSRVLRMWGNHCLGDGVMVHGWYTLSKHRKLNDHTSLILRQDAMVIASMVQSGGSVLPTSLAPHMMHDFWIVPPNWHGYRNLRREFGIVRLAFNSLRILS